MTRLLKAFCLSWGVASLASMPATAGTDFGTDEDVQEMVQALIDHVDENGVEATKAALNNPDHRLGGHSLGLMIWVEGKMGMHNKIPDLAGVDFESLQDLRGNYVIEDFSAQADDGGGYSLNYWPHYDTGDEYEYHCWSEWAKRDEVMVTACR